MMPEAGQDEEENTPNREQEDEEGDAIPKNFDVNANKEEPFQLKAEFKGFNPHEHDLIQSSNFIFN